MLARLERASWRPDLTLVMGDLVDYGPAPAAVIKWARRQASAIVCGNHDYAVATSEDCRSAPLFHSLAVATRLDFRSRAEPDALSWLGAMPLTASVTIRRDRWQLVHATPRDPLFEHVPATAPDETWRAAIASRDAGAAALLLGHSHEPFVRTIHGVVVVNPGSVGLPKDSDPRASYATWEDGRFMLHRVEDDTDAAVRRYHSLAIPNAAKQDLAIVIRTGSIEHLLPSRRRVPTL